MTRALIYPDDLTAMLFEELCGYEQKLELAKHKLKQGRIMADLALRRAGATFEALRAYGACGSGRMVICEDSNFDVLRNLLDPPKKTRRRRTA